ncbi:MAG: permease [Chloroflexi bacterium]|nr:permease [Chloroflexota bacterium]
MDSTDCCRTNISESRPDKLPTMAAGAAAAKVAAVAVFLASLGLLLFAVVDIRRGFLLPAAAYAKVGAPSVLLYLNVWHLPLLLAGGVGLWLGYRLVARLHGTPEGMSRLVRVLAIGIVVLLVVDLFTYRAVPAARALAAGKLGVGQAIPYDALPPWVEPFGSAANYLLLVWHATVLGLLLGGLYLTVAPGIVSRLSGRGFVSHLAGSGAALAQPFCSCCAAPIGGSLYRAGASLGPVLAFTVSAPMLNITGLILASALLPTQFAVLRIAGGVVVGVFVTYLVAIMARRWAAAAHESHETHARWTSWAARAMDAYARLFRLEELVTGRRVDSPATLVTTWLGMTWRLARLVAPVLFTGAVLAAALVRLMPSSGNTAWTVAAASAVGTAFMIPTWTEIPLAAGMIDRGLTGPAAALLLTLPAVSIPCLAVLAGATRSAKAPLLLALLIMVLGMVAGLLFL